MAGPSTGLSAAILLLYSGEILGASGIISSILLNPKTSLTDETQHWKLVFVATFLLMAHLYFVNGFTEVNSGVSFTGYAIAGLCVGFGTKLGSGCTSGHGICGLARRSKRSMVSVATFMGVGFLTRTLLSSSTIKDHVAILETTNDTMSTLPHVGTLITMFFFFYTVSQTLFVEIKAAESETRYFLFRATAVSAAFFAGGLSVSGMVMASKVFGFLNLNGLTNGTYDPTLIVVMGAGSIVSFISYQFVPGHNVVEHDHVLSKPLAHADRTFSGLPTAKDVDWQLVVGAVLFGFGWAIGGLCPGPALVHAAIGSTGAVVAWWPCFIVGAFLAQLIKNRLAKAKAKEDEPVLPS